MTTEELKNEILDTLLDAETALSKSRIMVDDLCCEYFDKIEPKSSYLQIRYSDAQIKNSIMIDYLVELEKHLKKMEDILKTAEQQVDKGAEYEPRTN